MRNNLDKKKEILVLQNSLCEDIGNFGNLFIHDGFGIEKVYALRDDIPKNIEKYSVVIILGGPMSVYDNLPYISQEIELVQEAISDNKMVLGICLGSQVIAKACGGKVLKGKIKEIGWKKIKITEEGKESIFNGIGKEIIEVFQWHGDTFELPNGAKILSNSSEYIQAFRIKNVFGLQFHCEVNRKMIGEFINNYRDELKHEDINPETILSDTNDSMRVMKLEKTCEIIYHNIINEVCK